MGHARDLDKELFRVEVHHHRDDLHARLSMCD